jgi:hypothetical protein
MLQCGIGLPVLLLLAALFVAPGSAVQKAAVNPDAKLLQDLQQRIADYQKLQKRAGSGAPALKQTDSPEQIEAARDALAERIRAARPQAQQGEIFTPAIADHLRALLGPGVKGPAAGATKKALKDDAPGAVPLKVNARYPDNEPLPTAPPELLMRLPKLPEGLEYRVIGRTLILRDTRANLIVDLIPRALPGD